ncbi:flap endonuclease-1 [Candidatus Woesearchaeota archaeon CG10_big_fil_rev_8_21_14_0_10_44_13]|nr:MAG: flap endonuclease-1 [Candidatus Woesearchaeota archaeon CG10_big_fil_rev_8_21_14_0_10_44_13]
MGTKLKEITLKKEISIEDMAGKRLVVDSYNVMYQFLTTIRMKDGSLLTDSKGNVTSHLTGLFSRSMNLMQRGVKLAFVFDGKAPLLKERERQRRRSIKEEAAKEYEKAKEEEDVEAMKKYAARTSRLTPEMVEDAKKLIKAMGMPVIQAPSEGEAQAAHIVRQGHAYAEISQDFDCMMFGVPRLIRNLTVSERRKLPGKMAFVEVKPELIDLEENLRNLGITQDQLIALCMLMGTDYNPNGIKGIGPKNALKLVKEHKDFSKLFSEVKWKEHFDLPWEDVFDTIKKMPVTDSYDLEWKEPDRERLIRLLCDEHDFSLKRVEDSLEKLGKEKEKKTQKGLGDFFGKR